MTLAATTARVGLTPDEVRDTFIEMNAWLNSQFLERRAALQAMTLAVLSKEHCFILGPPGTGKSAMTRSMFGAFTGAEYFEAVLSKTRPAEAILGPYDIPALRDHGHLHRKINGFLPTCNFGMLDELGKMSPTLGHDLLPVILERRLHQVNGGRSWVAVPLYTIIGGSNELPTDETNDAAALWDRMLVRVAVEDIREAGNFAAMLVGDVSQPCPYTIDFPSLAHVVDHVVPNIPVPNEVLDALINLRESMGAAGIHPSGRRWRQCMNLLRASAFLEGRKAVDVDDLQVLRFALWEDPTQIDGVERLTLRVSNPLAELALSLREKANEINSQVIEGKGLNAGDRAKLAVQLNGNLKTLSVELAQIRQKAIAQGASTVKLDEVGDYIAQVKRSVLHDILDIDIT